jgi:predicted metallopeptidase
VPTIYSVFPVYEVGTTAGQEFPYGGDRANIMYPDSTAIKLVRSEDFSLHKTLSNFRRHYKLYNGYFTRHYIMTETISDSDALTF